MPHTEGMTRKDYTNIAGTLRAIRKDEDETGKRLIDAIAIDLAENVFQPDNPRFDRARFLEAVTA